MEKPKRNVFVDKNTKKKNMDRQPIKKGGSAKKKSKFPDHSGDGKITKKDILMAKGMVFLKRKRKKRRGEHNG